MEWVKTSGQNAAMFLPDFEKAYDRVEWGFILMMLEAFGFPGEFCKWVIILLKDALTQVEVNGSLSQNITLSRSIRQGCPLGLALFVIASDALYYILRDLTISPKVQGVKLLNGDELINAQFVDDMTLFIELSKLNMEA
ncbi:secreted RxLR effector protein 78-like [Cryptomeria japonica]|uniref:secreted RxLR effector protein 78-like n=1 Tax=Cryptomeria japonica TaxID=3369 RepID=UPI0027DA2DC7|nr:secreted RxLR effector protein 78-like [Cryptomeria japonica]